MYIYSNQTDETDPHKLPDVQILRLTAEEVAERDEDLIDEYMKRHEYRLASMNTRAREAMLAAMIDNEGIRGGYFYQFCFPGCLPESSLFGPYDTVQEAVEAARESVAE